MSPDPVEELRYALAETDAGPAAPALRARVLAAGAAARTPGYPSDPSAHITGAEVFSRMARRLQGLLSELGPDEWSATSIRGLMVQELVGHVVRVEHAFARADARPAPLLLTGPGGGTWDLSYAGPVRRAGAGPAPDAHLTVSASTFCRVAANRASMDSVEVAVQGDHEAAAALFAGAATLALD